MFTPEERGHLRSELLAWAAKDSRISGAAITGSAAVEREDQWSDIDVALGVADAAEIPIVMADWTTHMHDQQLAVHRPDVPAGGWIHRFFLLPSTLQVDLAFVAATDFWPMAETFQLAFGSAQQARTIPAPRATHLVGMAWLYALHARNCIVDRPVAPLAELDRSMIQRPPPSAFQS